MKTVRAWKTLQKQRIGDLKAYSLALKNLVTGWPRFLARGGLKKSLYYLRQYGIRGFARKIEEKLTFAAAVHMEIKVATIPILEFRETEIVPAGTSVSVIIPTKNAGEGFRRAVSMLRNQKGFRNIEIVIVDSGSRDATVDIAHEYGAKVIEIPPESFSHSYSRNLGSEHASGDYLFFSVQDALPLSPLLLYNLFTAMRNNGTVAASCAEWPMADADLFYRSLSWNHYNFLGVNDRDRILSLPGEENFMTLRQNGQLSDIACLIRRDVFAKYRYRFDYAEDLDLGIRLIRDGYTLSFLGSTRIGHSHNRSAYYFLKRGYVDNIFLARTFEDFTWPDIPAYRLLADIPLAYEALNSLAAGLYSLSLPCRVKDLSQHFAGCCKKISEEGFAASSDVEDPDCIDGDFRTFLKAVRRTGHVPANRINPGGGVLTPGIEDFARIILAYLEASYDFIDNDILDDFRSSLYKCFGLLCGANLARSNLKYPGDMGEICANLEHGI